MLAHALRSDQCFKIPPSPLGNIISKAALKTVPKVVNAEPKVNVQVQAEADVDQGAPEHSYALVTPPSPGMDVK